MTFKASQVNLILDSMIQNLIPRVSKDYYANLTAEEHFLELKFSLVDIDVLNDPVVDKAMKIVVGVECPSINTQHYQSC